MFNKEIFGDVYYHIIADLISTSLSRFTTQVPLKILQNFIESTTLPMLRMCWERILLLEMHLADADGLLQGDNENKRFEFFVREVIKPDNFLLIIEKYPRLYERWQYQSALYFNSIETTITRLIADQTGIAKYFFGDKSICEIKKIVAVGDAHHGMEQTIRIEYLNEFDILRIIYYKPRCLNIDAGLVKFFYIGTSIAKLTIEHQLYCAVTDMVGQVQLYISLVKIKSRYVPIIVVMDRWWLCVISLQRQIFIRRTL